MAADPSAYAALGLAPGADAAAIEQAYKRLIKQHHPDRAGGDARRAAEINRAYRELRPASGARALELEPLDARWQAPNLWVRAALFGLASLAVLLLATGPIREAARTLAAAHPAAFAGRVEASATPADPMDEPLAAGAIGAGIREARAIAAGRDEMALASASQECQRRLRAAPGLAAFDRCAAFDNAVVQLQDRDPLRDRGPFSELAVTGRQMSNATLISNDYLAIDSRLDRIRLEVELALAPPLQPPQPPLANTAD